MKKILLIALFFASGAHAEYNPFVATPQAAPSAPISQSGSVPQPAEVTDPSAQLDKELKGLLNDINTRDEQDKIQDADVTQYVATTNCIDIYYHTIEKRYEERKSKACLHQETKDKIIQEIKKNEINHKSAGK